MNLKHFHTGDMVISHYSKVPPSLVSPINTNWLLALPVSTGIYLPDRIRCILFCRTTLHCSAVSYHVTDGCVMFRAVDLPSVH